MKATELTAAFVRQRTDQHRHKSPEDLAKLIAAGMSVGVSSGAPPSVYHAFMLRLNELFPDDGWAWCPVCLHWKTPVEAETQPCPTCTNPKP